MDRLLEVSPREGPESVPKPSFDCEREIAPHRPKAEETPALGARRRFVPPVLKRRWRDSAFKVSRIPGLPCDRCGGDYRAARMAGPPEVRACTAFELSWQSRVKALSRDLTGNHGMLDHLFSYGVLLPCRRVQYCERHLLALAHDSLQNGKRPLSGRSSI